MKGIIGNFWHAELNNENTVQLECLENTLILLNEVGLIVDIVGSSDDAFEKIIIELKENNQLEDFSGENYYILPGLVDLHVHAPQYPNAGTGLYLPLEEWLNEITFPLESSYKDINQAKKIYPELVESLLRQGTTCVLYFSTIHEESTIELAKICLEKGQRSFIGKVCMDNPDECPSYYIENTKKVLFQLKMLLMKFIDYQMNLQFLVKILLIKVYHV